MTYTPTTWDVGDVITPQKMNNIETGIQEVAESGGYDAEIRYYNDNNSSHDPVVTVVSGDYDTLMGLIEDNISPNVLVRYWDDFLYMWGVTNAVAIYTWDSSEGVINFTMQLPKANTNSGASASERFYGRGFSWNSNDEVWF